MSGSCSAARGLCIEFRLRLCCGACLSTMSAHSTASPLFTIVDAFGESTLSMANTLQKFSITPRQHTRPVSC